MKQRVYLGTYTLPILFGTGEIVPGKGKGIHVLELDTESGALGEVLPPQETPNPSFLTIHPNGKTLYAVNELKEYQGQFGGSVSAFAIEEGGALRYLNTQPTLGQDPCHLSVSPGGQHLVIANFMSGSVCVYALLEGGELGERTDFIQHEGSSVLKARQAGPHAHAALFDPRGGYVLIPDLGKDQVVVYKLDDQTGKLLPAPCPAFTCAPGAGPRSGEFHPVQPLFYSINELASSVTVLSYDFDTAQMTALQTISTLPEGFAGNNTCADLHISLDGRFVYASNRGHDSLMIFAVNEGDGTLAQIAAVPTCGRTPRQFAIAGSFVLVGNQDSDAIVVFRRDADNGGLTKVAEVEAPTPVCVLPV